LYLGQNQKSSSPFPFDILLLSSTGAVLKEVEDKLDSLICAYVAAYWWYWGKERNLVLGDRTTGYIVIPQRN
jgi:predicted RNase H-like nuclease